MLSAAQLFAKRLKGCRVPIVAVHVMEEMEKLGKGGGVQAAVLFDTIPRAGAELLIDYLTQPAQQIATAKENGFFPVTSAPIPADLSAGVKLEADAIAA